MNVYDKGFLTYKEMIEKLRSKNLKIEDEDKAKELLEKYSYFDFISGYKQLFKDKQKNYKHHTSIEDIHNLYIFDEDLRALFFQYILKVEKNIKSLLSYSFCEKYGNNQSQYLLNENYNNSTENKENIIKLIGILEKSINDTKAQYIKHHLEKYNNVPLWVLMKILTLGCVSKMYNYLDEDLKIIISKKISFVGHKMLTQMLYKLAIVRNICAHNERLYDYKGKPLRKTRVHEQLNIPVKKGSYIYGVDDLFSVVITLKFLLSSDDFNEFINLLEDLITDFSKSTPIIPIQSLYKKMGFPKNWTDVKDVNLTI